MPDLHGRVALVTGASRGIGRAIARALAHAGADVAINFRANGQEAEKLRAELVSSGGRAVTARADVSKAAEVDRLVDEVHGALGAIDILVNNAGISLAAGVDAVTEDAWDRTIATNLTSAFLVTQAVLPAMRARRWGRLVFVSSVAAHVGGIVGPHYAASKAGMHGLMHYYAAHLAKDGITANAVAPALVETDMIAGNPGARPEMIPVGRFGQPSEVASAVLMCVENGYVTGQVINVDGGMY